MHFISKAALFIFASCTYVISVNAQAKKYSVAEGISAQITHSQGDATIEVVIPGTDKMILDLTQPGAGIFQIKTTDYNFDSYKDFAFVGANATGSIQVYDIFLYNATDGAFEALGVPDGACEYFGNVGLSPTEKTLRSSCRDGNKSSLDIFKWSTPFNLELDRSEDNSSIVQAEGAEEKAARKADAAGRRKDKREALSDKMNERKDQRETASGKAENEED